MVPIPNAHRQWNATGTVSTNATLPLHRCSTATHPGARPAAGSRPHIHNAVANCTPSSTTAAVLSRTFIGSMPENPSVNGGRPLGVCTFA